VNRLLALAWVPLALDRKLLRDLARMWSQALTIALVVASGVGGFVTSLSAVDSLVAARDRFYAEERFADVFASVKRAPDALAETLRAIPGVADVQTTVEQVVDHPMPGVPRAFVIAGSDQRGTLLRTVQHVLRAAQPPRQEP